MHTCRKWRQIVFTSQFEETLVRLGLFCTRGTPVQKNLNCWTALPIVVQYGGLPTLGPPTLEDDDNIVTALKQSDRVISISLTITTPLLKKLSTVEGEFSQLQDLVLLSRDAVLLTLIMPSAFRWGRRLRRLHLTGVAFPALLQLLSSSTNLIDLRLHDVFLPWHFSPELLMKALSHLGQLRSLSLHFCSAAYYRHSLPPDTERILLPVLNRLNFRGSMAYFEGIVTSIDAPFLKDIEITFFENYIFALSELNKFFSRIEIYSPHCGTHFLSSEPTISISLTQPGSPTYLKLLVKVLRQPLHVQISSMARICLGSSPFLFNDEGIIRTSRTRPSMDTSHSRALLVLLNQITGKQLFHLDIIHSINVVHTFQPQRRSMRMCHLLCTNSTYRSLGRVTQF